MTKCGKTDKKTDHFYLNVFFAFGKYSDALKIQFGFLSYHEGSDTITICIEYYRLKKAAKMLSGLFSVTYSIPKKLRE